MINNVTLVKDFVFCTHFNGENIFGILWVISNENIELWTFV
jgi:hypothetical protein